MKICKLTNGLLVSLLFISVAEADSKYPATDFQPKVVYQDTEYKQSGSSSSSSSSKASSGKKSSADPAYPAANFEPEVLFKDESYTHKKDKAVAYSGKSGSSATSSTVSENSTEGSAQAEDGDSSLDLVIGLALLAIAGFVFYTKNMPKSSAKKSVFRKKAAKKIVRKASSAAASNGGPASGVSKYLEGKAGVEPSSVAKYLDERKTGASGVAKYVAKQKVSARVASVTGVEKYLKDKS